MSHPVSCRDSECALTYREHLLDIAVHSSVMPNRRRETCEINARQRRWDADMPAYKRLVEGGTQPPRIDGCARREARANTVQEITDRPT